MNTILIETDINSVESIKEGILKLNNIVFTDYTAIHKLAKKDNKALDINLKFVINDGSQTNFLTRDNEQTELWDEVTLGIPNKYKNQFDDHSFAEFVFFYNAFKHNQLNGDIISLINRVSSYNFGTYAKTLCYPDKTPVAFWAVFFLMNNSTNYADVCINYFGSLNLPNHFKRKWGEDDFIQGFLYPLTVSALNYVYKKQNWTADCLKILASQISHYAYDGIPDLFLDQLKNHNPYNLLLDEDECNNFLQNYITEQRAVYNDSIASGAENIVSQVLTLIIDDQIIEEKTNYIIDSIEKQE